MKQIKKSVNSVEFTTPIAATADYYLELTTNKDQILADGHSNTLITCTVKDKDGNVYKDKDFTVEFKTNGRGHFTRSEVVTADGVTTNTLISESLDKAEEVTVTAQIVRTVMGDDLGEQFKGVNGKVTLTMTPEVTNVKYNPVTSAESNYADRITLRFQDVVDDDDYKTNGVMDPDKMLVEVYDDIPSNGAVPSGKPTTGYYSNEKDEDGIVNLREVANEKKALHVLVKNPLANNRTIGVRVTQTNPETGKKSVFTESFKLTDSQRPQLMSVQALDRRTLKVTYSEAVLTEREAKDNGVNFRADDVNHYNIGVDRLNDTKWGTTENPVKITAGTGAGEDDRNVVTIKLGKNSSKEYARFAEEVQTLLSVNNVGDWAANTSGSNNVITTDEKYFVAPKDDKAPAIEKVEVQSPEQYLVTFNAPVEMSATYGKNSDSNSDIVGIEAKNADTATIKDGDKNPNYKSGETSLIQLVENGTNIGSKDGVNPIRVTQIGSDNKTYLIETTKDWSKVYGQTGSYNDNYYNNHTYQLRIPASAITNINNGMKNAGDVTYALSDDPVMKTRDVEMPQLDGEIAWNGEKATVKFNEPVKIRVKDQQYGLNKEGLTPSVRQEADTSKGVQQATAVFHAPNHQDVTGTIESIGDDYDKSIVVKPDADLAGSAEGVKWTLTVSGISDDVDNTVSRSGDITVKSSTTGFRVAWASVSTSKEYEWDRSAGNWVSGIWNAGNKAFNEKEDIYVFVKFTGPIDSQALRALNYTLNSSQLSTNVDISPGIEKYDDNSSIKDSITIRIPWNNAWLISQNPGRVMMTITDSVKSASGQSLENNIEYQLPYKAHIDESNGGIGIPNYGTTDAVFGDDPSEQYNVPTADTTIKAGQYQAKVEEAIKSNEYRRIKLTDNITGTLNVTRPVDIDLNGNFVEGIKANFDDGATCRIINTNPTTSSTVNNLEINTPNADWNLNEDQKSAASNVTFVKVNVRSMPANTLNNWANIKELAVNSLGKAVKIVNAEGSQGTISEIILDAVNKDCKVTVRNDGANSIGKVTVNNSAQIIVDKDSKKGGYIIDTIDIAKKVTKDVVIQTLSSRKAVDTLTGTTNAATVKNESGEKVEGESASKLFTKVEVSGVDGLKEAVAKRLVNSVKASAVSGGSIAMNALVSNLSNPIDPNGAIIDPNNYEIRILASGEGTSIVEEGDHPTKFANGPVTITGWNQSSTNEIKVVIIDKTRTADKTENKTIDVKTIKVDRS